MLDSNRSRQRWQAGEASWSTCTASAGVTMIWEGSPLKNALSMLVPQRTTPPRDDLRGVCGQTRKERRGGATNNLLSGAAEDGDETAVGWHRK